MTPRSAVQLPRQLLVWDKVCSGYPHLSSRELKQRSHQCDEIALPRFCGAAHALDDGHSWLRLGRETIVDFVE